MKTRCLIWAGLLAVCFGIALAGLSWMQPGAGVTKAIFDRIRVGMTLAEVHTILGCEPRGDWTVKAGERLGERRRRHQRSSHLTITTKWCTPDGCYQIKGGLPASSESFIGRGGGETAGLNQDRIRRREIADPLAKRGWSGELFSNEVVITAK
jgi:hypothetical protein